MMFHGPAMGQTVIIKLPSFHTVSIEPLQKIVLTDINNQSIKV